MRLRYLKEEAYDRLYGSVDSNIKWYNAPMTRIDSIGIDDDCVGTSSIDLVSFTLATLEDNASDAEKNENDLVNIRIVYSAWKRLTPLQASNRLLWTYYCHCEPAIGTYIRSRWMDGGFTDVQVRNTFFVTGNKRNLVRGNALSSLWWKGYLTYDDTAKNPFWITETLGTSTNLADFLDTFNSYSRTRTRGMIRAVADVINELRLDRLRNQPLRDLNKYMNRYSAVAPLDFFTEAEIYDLTKKKFMSICLGQT